MEAAIKRDWFAVCDQNGEPVIVRIHVRESGMKELLVNGRFCIDRIEKGQYMLCDTGEILTSDDPNAP